MSCVGDAAAAVAAAVAAAANCSVVYQCLFRPLSRAGGGDNLNPCPTLTAPSAVVVPTTAIPITTQRRCVVFEDAIYAITGFHFGAKNLVCLAIEPSKIW